MSLIPERRHYVVIFFISLAILTLEIAVARMLSVALFSHYAFVAVSLAMFGLGLSALAVYLFPSRFPPAAVDRQLVTYSAFFGLSAAVAVLLFLHVHVVQQLSLAGFATLSLAYAVLAVPFFLGGLCVSLLMTHFAARIGQIYNADLVGASMGCLVVVVALNFVPAPQVALFVAALVTGATLLVAWNTRPRKLAVPAACLVSVLCLLLIDATTNMYSMRYIKNRTDFYSSYAKWNAFSRVSAFPWKLNAAQVVPLKGPQAAWGGDRYPGTMMLDIDGAAFTPMMEFNGDVSSIQFLRRTVLYAAHQIKPRAKVLVIGTGGGRDLLAALAFGQPSILGIEINPLMKQIVEDRYGDYSGHPYTQPSVHVIIDEARSRLGSIKQTFDIIQLSLIDTFSLNAAGSFVFSENYLYTTEAFQEYFRHLTSDGILTLTRYFVPRYPLEVLRLAAMARAAWEAEGVDEFRNHAIVLSQGLDATILVKRSRYSQKELSVIGDLARANNMKVLYSPGQTGNGHTAITTLITSPTWRAYVDNYDFMIDPPTDDRPFFFNFLRGPIDVPVWKDDPFEFLRLWNDALLLMYMLITVVTVMAVLFFVVPLMLFGRRQSRPLPRKVIVPLLLYFACLGYGFMMIEVPLMQRFVLFLGYPVYALAVVLFSLLLFSGIGSLLTTRFSSSPKGALVRVLATIVGVSLAYAFSLSWIITASIAAPIALRILLTIILLAPIGLVMGMAYPLGITILCQFGAELVPWAWGLNGALSVVASVLATFLGGRIGFTGALLTGVGAYALGLILMVVATTRQPAGDIQPVAAAGS